jgi:hypothetical protein
MYKKASSAALASPLLPEDRRILPHDQVHMLSDVAWKSKNARLILEFKYPVKRVLAGALLRECHFVVGDDEWLVFPGIRRLHLDKKFRL